MARTSRITVEIEMGVDPIRGSIERSDGHSRPFWGWLELIETLARAAANEPEVGPGPSLTEPWPPAKPGLRAEVIGHTEQSPTRGGDR